MDMSEKRRMDLKEYMEDLVLEKEEARKAKQFYILHKVWTSVL